MSIWLDIFRQCFFIPKPTLTEQNLPDQKGRVLIVTGGYAGCGKELSKILYGKNGTVYVAGRSQDKAEQAIEEIKKAHPNSDGRIEFLKIDLADLATIKASADEFLKKEQRLDVLTNNAGVMGPPKGSKSAQGADLQMGTNCLGHFLFTQLLTPLLQKTAASSPPGSVRVTWAASMGIMGSPSGGVAWDTSNDAPKDIDDPMLQYMHTKAGNVLLARAFHSRYEKDGIVSNSWNPGNLKTELPRNKDWLFNFMISPLLYHAIFGAYTELFAGWADDAGKKERGGAYIGPWGRFVMLRKDIDESPNVTKFWEWCEKETKPYAS